MGVNLKWRLFDDMLSAESIIFDHSDADDSPLVYSIFCYGDGDEWKADFDGRDIAHGSLEHCMAACAKIEAEAMNQAIENQREHDESWPKGSDENDSNG